MSEAQAKAAEKPKAKTKSVIIFGPGKVAVSEKTKLPPQAKVIVAEVMAAKKINKPDLIKAVTPKIKTKQPVERILGYYQKRLVDEGYVTVTKEKVAA